MWWKPRNVKNQFKLTVKIELKNTLLKLLVKKYIKRNKILSHVFVKEVKSIRMLRNRLLGKNTAFSKMLRCEEVETFLLLQLGPSAWL